MSTFHNPGAFADLRNYAEKLIKFKQGVSLKSAQNEGLVDPAHHEFVAKGACTVFVLDWIAEKKIPFRSSLFHRGKGVKSATDDYSTMAAAFAIDEFAKFAGNAKLVGSTGARTFLAYQKGLRFIDEKEIFDNHFDVVYSRIVSSIKPDQAYYISAITNDGASTDSHALGMYKDKENGLHFFDPNVGEYLIKDAAGFFRVYSVKVIEAFKFVYGGATAKPVKPV
jgi:hypothetical protein